MTVAAILLIVGLVLANRRLAAFVPYIVGLLGIAIAGLGATTGASANPARQLGPALFSGQRHLLAVYLLPEEKPKGLK